MGPFHGPVWYQKTGVSEPETDRSRFTCHTLQKPAGWSDSLVKTIGIGAGYMGKLHSVAMQAVGAVFNTQLRPVCEMLCATTEAGAARKAAELGFRRSTADWRALVADPAVEAIVIASPQSTHREIALAAFAAGKPVLCEKPMGASLAESVEMTEAAESSGIVNMAGSTM